MGEEATYLQPHNLIAHINVERKKKTLYSLGVFIHSKDDLRLQSRSEPNNIKLGRAGFYCTPDDSWHEPKS